MKLDLNKSRIIATKSQLHIDALHIDCELFGHIENMKPNEPARLLNFYRKDANSFVVAPQDSTNHELVPIEEFSKQIWTVRIEDDWNQLEELEETKLYAEIVHSGKMFFTLRFDK